MKLDISKEEFEKLLELAYMGDWMLNGRHDPEERDKDFEPMLQKLYAMAEEQGMGYLIMTDEETGLLKPSPAFDARIDGVEHIAHYDDHVFWDELALRLAERDLQKEVGAEVYKAMRPHEREEKVDELAAGYDDEFEKRGLERLRIEGRMHRARRKRDSLTDRLRKLFDEGKE